MRAIISRGLYNFYPIFTAVYIQKRLILQTILQTNPRFIIKSGFKSRVGYNGGHTVSIFLSMSWKLHNPSDPKVEITDPIPKVKDLISISKL